MGFIAAAAIAVGATAYAASESANSKRKAQDRNLAYAADVNDANYRKYLESRGDKGNALLPLYLRDANGNAFEGGVLGQHAMDIYNTEYNQFSPDDQISQAKAILAQFQPTIDASNRTAAGIFNGDLSREELNNEGEVAAARNQGVQTRKQSGLEALSKTLNDINDIQAGKGYASDSLGTNLTRFDATRRIFGDAANDQSNANLATAAERFGIKTADINRRVASLSLPYSMARQNISLANLPYDAASDQEARRQQLFNFFKMGQGQFKYNPMPTVQPIASTGQIVAQGISSLAGSFGTGGMMGGGMAGAGGGASAGVVDAGASGGGGSYAANAAGGMPSGWY